MVYIYHMGMNIKNPEAHRLAAELARRTGVSLTEAVTVALREKLAAIDAEQSTQAKFERIIRLSDAFAAKLPPEIMDVDIDDLLYDPDTGLPK